MKEIIEMIRKSIGASILVALGNYALLRLGSPIGPIIFAFGLLAVCYMGQNLFTGKCGFLFQDKMDIGDLILILLVNMVSGYLIGMALSVLDPAVVAIAVAKVETWNFSFNFFLNAVLCGLVMYIAVYMYRQGTNLGIIFGIPLFIFSGFQHCIANIITLGIAKTFDWSIVLAIGGNFAGSLLMWFVSKDMCKREPRLNKHEMKLNSQPFARIKDGSKTIEMRLFDEKRQGLRVGDSIEFTNRDTDEKILVRIQALYTYDNFEALYEEFDKTLLGYSDDEVADPKDMEKFYPAEEQEKYGVVGIKVKKI